MQYDRSDLPCRQLRKSDQILLVWSGGDLPCRQLRKPKD